MRILVAMDSFKGSLTAPEACRAVQEGLADASPAFDCDIMPIADGGEGFVDVLAGAAGGDMIPVECHDPLGRPLSAPFLRLPDGTAAVETAAASGLTLIAPGERDVMRATTLGTGEQLLRALECGAHTVYLGLGGSATTDGGLGLLRALGMRFYDARGGEVTLPAQLGGLARVDKSGLTPLLGGVRLVAASDVHSPLTGPEGAAHVFGPQKGASPAQVEHAARCYRALATALPLKARLVWFVRRTAKGLGGVEQVP